MTVKWMRAVQSLRQVLLTPSSVQTRTRHKGIIATVTGFPATAITIYLDGGTVAVPAHLLGGGATDYAPVVSDVVMVDNVGGDLVVIHKYAF